MPISSNRRQRVIDFATPKVADLVVVERVDRSKNVGSADAADNTAYGTAHPDTTNFPNFKLGLIKNGDDDQGQFQLWYYIKDRANQVDYNWEFSAAGGAHPRYDSVVRTYVLPRTGSGTAGVDYFDAANPVIGGATFMPSTATDPFEYNEGTSAQGKDENYILFERKQVRSGDETLDTLYVVEQRIYIKRIPMMAVDTDPDFPYDDSDGKQGGLHSKETIYHADEAIYATTSFTNTNFSAPNASSGTYTLVGSGITTEKAFRTSGQTITSSGNNFWGIDADGIEREGKQLSDNWFALLEREVVKLGTDGLVSDYYTYQTYYWPPVFHYLEHRIWGRRDGGSEPVLTPHFWHAAYRGPTRMRIRTWWKKTPWAAPTGDAVQKTLSSSNLTMLKPMVPLPMSFNTPMFDLSVEASLHDKVTLEYTTGSDHPVWDFASYTSTFNETNYNPADFTTGVGGWPDELIISDTQKPFRGGYLRECINAFRPEADRTVDPEDGE